MSERDWRILREDHEIYIKGGQCPNPVRSWDEVPGIPNVIRKNLVENGYLRPTAI
jgi:ATP-dependent RNA helicase DDX23/PRP28